MNNKSNKHILSLNGTPSALGVEIFASLLLPAIEQASRHVSSNELLSLYGGIFSALYGSMAANFGETLALDVFDSVIKGLQKSGPLDPLQ